MSDTTDWPGHPDADPDCECCLGDGLQADGETPCPCIDARKGEDLTFETETPRAWLDVMGERVRQITVEGWTQEHDDAHVEGELAGAASAYAMSAAAAIQLRRDAPLREIPPFFMFKPCHWKPTNARRDLVKAGALILAEIERLDRATRRSPAHDASPAVTDKEKEDDPPRTPDPRSLGRKRQDICA